MELTGFFGNAYLALWLFFFYAFAGVIAEMIYCWAIEYKGVIESRSGLLYLPFNLIYGIGGVVVTLVLIDNFRDPLLVFALGAVVCTALEYVASLFMEKVFKAVYWDYSKEFLNFQGRICLKYALIWGGLSLLLLYVIDIIDLLVIINIPRPLGYYLLAIVVVLTIASIVLTLAAYHRTEQKNTCLKAIKAGEDATLPTSRWARIVDRLVPDAVLVNTFPRMSIITEYQELSGHKRKLIVWNPKLGKPSALRVAAGERAAEQGRHAVGTAGG